MQGTGTDVTSRARTADKMKRIDHAVNSDARPTGAECNRR